MAYLSDSSTQEHDPSSQPQLAPARGEEETGGRKCQSEQRENWAPEGKKMGGGLQHRDCRSERNQLCWG
jgi:hypothetical protein